MPIVVINKIAKLFEFAEEALVDKLVSFANTCFDTELGTGYLLQEEIDRLEDFVHNTWEHYPRSESFSCREYYRE